MFLAWVNWCSFSVIVIRKAPCETPYQGLCSYHGNKRPKHHFVCLHSRQLVWWCWYCPIKFHLALKIGLIEAKAGRVIDSPVGDIAQKDSLYCHEKQLVFFFRQIYPNSEPKIWNSTYLGSVFWWSTLFIQSWPT